MRIPKRDAFDCRRLPWITFIFACLAVVIFLNPGCARLLEYHRARIADGQFWRILTCHLAHYSASHLRWDVLMLVVLGATCELQSRTSMLMAVGAAALLIPAALWCLLPGLHVYRGLSGIDCTLFMLAAGSVRLEHQKAVPLPRKVKSSRTTLMPWMNRALILLFVAKALVDCRTNRAMFVGDLRAGIVTVPLAHLVGAAIGWLPVHLRGVVHQRKIL